MENRISRRSFLAAAAVSAAAAAMAGCSGKNSREITNITVWNYYNGDPGPPPTLFPSVGGGLFALFAAWLWARALKRGPGRGSDTFLHKFGAGGLHCAGDGGII